MFRLQDKLEKQHLENTKVRQSLGEVLNNFENQEIQLALAMQDLMVATSEIKKASKMREQLNQLERCARSVYMRTCVHVFTCHVCVLSVNGHRQASMLLLA